MSLRRAWAHGPQPTAASSSSTIIVQTAQKTHSSTSAFGTPPSSSAAAPMPTPSSEPRGKRRRGRSSAGTTATTAKSPVAKRQKRSLGIDDMSPRFAAPSGNSATASVADGSIYDFPEDGPEEEEMRSKKNEGKGGKAKGYRVARKMAMPLGATRATKTTKPKAQKKAPVATHEAQEIPQAAAGTTEDDGPLKRRRGRPRKQQPQQEPPQPAAEAMAKKLRGRQRKVTAPMEQESVKRTRSGKSFRQRTAALEEEEEEDAEESIGDVLEGLMGAAKGPQGNTPPTSMADPQSPEMQQAHQRGNKSNQHQAQPDAATEEDEEEEQPQIQQTVDRSPKTIRVTGQIAEHHESDDEDYQDEERSAHELSPPRPHLSKYRQQQAADHEAQIRAVAEANDGPEDGDEAEQEDNAASTVSHPATGDEDNSTQPSGSHLRILDRINIATNMLRKYLSDLRKARKFRFVAKPEWLQNPFRLELELTIRVVGSPEQLGSDADFTRLEKYRKALLKLEETITQLKEEHLKMGSIGPRNALSREANFVSELISKIELVFRRRGWTDQSGKTWEEDGRKKLEWVLHMKKISDELAKAKELEEKRAAEEAQEERLLENEDSETASEAFGGGGWSDNEQEYEEDEESDSEHGSVDGDVALDHHHTDEAGHDEDYSDEEYESDSGGLVLGDDAPVERVRVDAFGNHSRRTTSSSNRRSHRQSSIAEDGIPWRSDEHKTLWYAMAKVMKDHGELLWTEVMNTKPELLQRGWQACEAEAKRARDLMVAAGNSVPSWLAKV